MKTLYNNFVSFIQNLPQLWFITIFCVFMALSLALIVKFFNQFNGEQKEFKRPSLLILAIICFAIVVFLTYVRN